jgi:DNA repair exonuclease SbcCD nuclease subunit
MAKIKLVHTADLHLGAPLTVFGDYAENRRQDLLNTFDRIVKLAVSARADILLLAGDLFNSYQVPQALSARVGRAFQELHDRGVTVVVIPGTHDHLQGQQSVYRRFPFEPALVLDRPELSEPVCLPIREEKVYLYGFAYQHGRSEQALASMKRRDMPGLHIGLLHCSLVRSAAWRTEAKDLPLTEQGLFDLKLDYLALGHYHNYQELSHAGMVRACYPGTPEGTCYDEQGDRYVALVELDADSVTVTRQAVNSKLVKERGFDLTGVDTATEIGQLLMEEAGERVILRAVLNGCLESPLDSESLSASLEGQFAHLEICDDATSLYEPIVLEKLRKERSVRGLFIDRILARMEDSESPDIRQQCQQAIKEVLAKFARLA